MPERAGQHRSETAVEQLLLVIGIAASPLYVAVAIVEIVGWFR